MTATTQDDNQELVRRVFDGFNQQDRDVVGDTLADDFVYNNLNRQEFLDVEFAFFEPFPDLTYALDDIFAADNMVACRWRLMGTHSGKGGPGVLRSIEPTGKKVEIPGISIARIKEGKIAEWWGEWRVLELYRELDAMKLLSE